MPWKRWFFQEQTESFDLTGSNWKFWHFFHDEFDGHLTNQRKNCVYCLYVCKCVILLLLFCSLAMRSACSCNLISFSICWWWWKQQQLMFWCWFVVVVVLEKLSYIGCWCFKGHFEIVEREICFLFSSCKSSAIFCWYWRWRLSEERFFSVFLFYCWL